MNFKKYVKIPIIIEAIIWTGEKNLYDDLCVWMDCDLTWDINGLTITTLEGQMKASIGDYIIKGVAGDFSTCEPDFFEASYEEVYSNVRFNE